jgi:hypothetical protein
VRTWEKVVVVALGLALAIAIGILSQPILDTLGEMLIAYLEELEATQR